MSLYVLSALIISKNYSLKRHGDINKWMIWLYYKRYRPCPNEVCYSQGRWRNGDTFVPFSRCLKAYLAGLLSSRTVGTVPLSRGHRRSWLFSSLHGDIWCIFCTRVLMLVKASYSPRKPESSGETDTKCI